MKILQTALAIAAAFQVTFLYAENAKIFQGPSLIMMPSTENTGRGKMDFTFSHRFGNAEKSQFAGLDNGASIMLSLDYGLSDRWRVGIARSSLDKTWEMRTQYNVLQTSGNIPMSVSLFGAAAQETADQNYLLEPRIDVFATGLPALDQYLNNKLNSYELNESDQRSFLASVLLSAGFSDIFSLQFSPMYVHRNFVKSKLSNDRLGFSLGGRFKLTKKIDFIFETIASQKRDYIGNSYEEADRKSYKDEYSEVKTLTADEINAAGINSATLPFIYLRNIHFNKPVRYHTVPLAAGIDIGTAAHNFQIFLTNSRDIAHTRQLRGAEFNYDRKEWTVGFNINRRFFFGKAQKVSEMDCSNSAQTFGDLQDKIKGVCTVCHTGATLMANFDISDFSQVKERTEKDPMKSLIYQKVTAGTMAVNSTPDINEALYCWIQNGRKK